MGQQTTLRTFIIVRRHDQHRIRANFLCILGELHCISGLIRARTSDDRDTSLDLIDSELDRCTMLFVRHRSRLTSRPRDDNRIRSLLDLILNDTAQLREIHAILGIRCDNGNTSTSENWFLHGKASYTSLVIIDTLFY